METTATTAWSLFPLGMQDAWLLPVLCLAAFVIIVLFGRWLPDKGSWVAIGAIGLGFILFWTILRDLLFSHPANYSFSWLTIPPGNGFLGLNLRLGMTVDQISVMMLGLVSFVALCVQVYSLGYMHGDVRYGWYYAAQSLFAASMLGLVLADNFLLLYITWELVGLCSYLLIGFWWERRPAAEAAKKAFVTTRIGDVGLLIGILILYRATGTFQMSAIFEAAEAGHIDPTTLTVAAILVFSGAMGKSAQFPLHVWLPDAMEGPTPVSALIHAATMVAAGVFLVARTYPLFLAAPVALQFVAIIGLITTFMAATMGLVMTDIKRVVAYSTISSLGLMMLSLGSGGYTGAMFYLLTHGFFKALLFLGSGSVIHATEKQDIAELGGLWRKMPLTGATFLAGSLAMMGLPPFAGFFSKDEIVVAVSHNPVIYALTLFVVFLTAVYMVRLVLLTFFGQPRDHHAYAHAHESPPSMTIPLVALAFLAIFSGFLAFDWVGPTLGLPKEYLGVGSYLVAPGEHPEAFIFHPDVAGLSTALALVGAVVGLAFYSWRVWSPEAMRQRFGWLHTLLVNKYYMDDLYQWIIDHVALALAGFIAWFDRVFINDIGVNGAGFSAIWAGLQMRYHETGRLYNYGLVMAAGVITIIVAAVALVI